MYVAQALNSMLMSWYMAGYHAGHYQGLKLAAASAHKQNKSKKSS
jgi:hypothetical protein